MERATVPFDLHRPPTDGRRERGSRRQGLKDPRSLSSSPHPGVAAAARVAAARPAHAPARRTRSRRADRRASGRGREPSRGGAGWAAGMPGSGPVSRLDSPSPHPHPERWPYTPDTDTAFFPAWGASRSSGHRDRDYRAGRWPGWAPRRGKFGRGKVPVAPPGRGRGMGALRLLPRSPRRAAPRPPLPGPFALSARSLPRRRSVILPRAPRALTSGSGRAAPWSAPWDASERQDPGQVRLWRPLGGAEGEREREGEPRRRVRACVEERESEGVCVSD